MAQQEENVGVMETRKHLHSTLNICPVRPMRQRLLTSDSLAELVDLLREWKDQDAQHLHPVTSF